MSKFALQDLNCSADEEGVQIAIGNAATRLNVRDAVALGRYLTNLNFGEQRTGFRVPVELLLNELKASLSSTLVYKGTIYDAVPIDLSLTGILVKASKFEAPVGAELTTRLIVEDHLAKLRSTIVRIDGSLVALHFSECMEGGELNPPPQLGPVFSRLERIYLNRRRQGLG